MIQTKVDPKAKGKKAKPNLGGGGKNDRNNNPGMIDNLMGGGDEEEKEEEAPADGGREVEAEYDFM